MAQLSNLATFISNLTWRDTPFEAQDAAIMQTLDTVSVAVGAQGNELLTSIQDMYAKLITGENTAALWGKDTRVPPNVAALLNGIAGHLLELDDVHTASKTHIGTVVVPAAWAMAQHIGASGKSMLLAIICGTETMSRIGMALDVKSHRLRGWHVTSTAGTFGAAAACAKLLRLNASETASALGLAGTQSFGVWAFLEDSTSNKVLHPGRAAQLGMESAMLAQAGMSGPEHILEASDGGLLNAMSDAGDLSFVDRALGDRWEILYRDNKPYPCCRSTHCCIDATLFLKAEFNIPPERIAAIVVDTYEVGYLQCGVSEGSIRPQKAIDAKFSTPYCVASAFVGGEVTHRDFLPEAINNITVQALVEKVKVNADKSFSDAYPAHWGCRVTITLTDGSMCSHVVTDASGSIENPLSRQQIITKVTDNFRTLYSNCKADSSVNTILALAEANVIPTI